MRKRINPADLTRDLGGRWLRSYGTAPCPCCQPERRRDQNALTISDGGGCLLMNCKKSACAGRVAELVEIRWRRNLRVT